MPYTYRLTKKIAVHSIFYFLVSTLISLSATDHPLSGQLTCPHTSNSSPCYTLQRFHDAIVLATDLRNWDVNLHPHMTFIPPHIPPDKHITNIIVPSILQLFCSALPWCHRQRQIVLESGQLTHGSAQGMKNSYKWMWIDQGCKLSSRKKPEKVCESGLKASKTG